MLNALIVIVFILIVIVVARNSFETVPPIHFAVPIWFGKRIKTMVLYEGLQWKPPFSVLWTESLVPRTLKADCSFFTKNNREVVVKTTTRWKPDPTIKGDGGPRCLEITDNFIDQGLKSKIESEIGRFGGVHEHGVFIEKRRAIEHLIDSILRLEKPPHVDPADFTGEDIHTEIEREKRLEFYDKFSNAIGEYLRDHAQEQKSHTERFYGVDILDFTVDDVTFSDKTKDTLEARERARDEMERARLVHAECLSMTEDLKKRGVSPEAALDAANAATGVAEKKSFSIPALSIPALNKLFGGGE